MNSSTDPFLPGPRLHIPGAAAGPLAGLTFAVKDLIDLAGHPTLGGTPDWDAPRPTRHAGIVQALLDAGASVVGKTVTDEVSLGILGENAHDGTPLNPAAPDHVPGGSSSGSASATASGLCDFALGTDTGGSVRVPASFCGLYGIRPTHGRLDFTGITVQAPSSDTVGWFARDAATFARIGTVLFGPAGPMPTTLPSTLLVATDAFGFAEDGVRQALAPMVERLARLIGTRMDVTLAPPGLSVWQRAQRVLQSSESWATFGPWLDRCNPRLAFGVSRALVAGSMMTEAERAAATLMRIEARARLRHLLPPGTILCLPTTPFPAPRKGLPNAVLNPLRDRISCLTSHGGLCGVPQVSLPGATLDGLPIGLSIVAARGLDETLLTVAQHMEAT